jgi:hypothetical protein
MWRRPSIMTCESGRALGHRKPAPAGRLKLISSAIVPVCTIGSPRLALRAAIVLGVALAIASTPALAEIQVRGSPEAVTIEARDISVEDILAALSRTFDIDYQSSVDLDKPLHGTYVGPLSRVLTRILQGYNFVLKNDNGSIAITVVGTPHAPVATSAPTTVAASGGPQAPAPAPQQSGAPAPVPRASGSTAMPAPVPRAVGSTAMPAPQPGSSGGTSAPVAGPKPPSAPPGVL